MAPRLTHPASMPNDKSSRRLIVRRHPEGRTLLRYFWHGIFIIAPISLTLAALVWLFNTIDGLLRPYVQAPGIGFVLVLVIIIAVGWISSFFLIRRVFSVIDRWLEQTPGISFLYSSLRDFFDAFIGNKRRFSHSVLVNVLADDVWLLGFLTSEDVTQFKLGASHVAVYAPQAYNVAGQLFLVPRDRVRLIDHLAPADVMKYAVTGGAVEIVAPKAS